MRKQLLKPSLATFFALGLLLMLIAVVMLIRGINEKSMATFLEAIGIETGQSAAHGFFPKSGHAGEDGEKFLICSTRIVAIEFIGKGVLKEKFSGISMSWLWSPQDGQSHYLNTIRMEQWLSRFCLVDIAEETTEHEWKPYLVIQYVNGHEQVLYRNNAAYFFAERAFRSSELDQGLSELLSLTVGVNGVD